MSKLAQARIDEVTTCHICGEDLPLASLPVACGEGLWRHPECEPIKPPQVVRVTGNVRPLRQSEAQLAMRKCWGDAVELVRGEFPNASGEVTVEAASHIAVALFNRTAGL